MFLFGCKTILHFVYFQQFYVDKYHDTDTITDIVFVNFMWLYNMVMKGKVLAWLLILCSVGMQAQISLIHEDFNQVYLEGLSLYEKGLYSNAQQMFEQVMETVDEHSELRKNAQYYSALCALELFNKDTDDLLKEFLQEHPHTNKSEIVEYQLGRYYYQRKAYSKAIEWLEKVDKYELDMYSKEEYYFKLGFSYFNQRQKHKDYLEKAQAAFYEVKSDESVYALLAIYYHSHILYSKGKYQTALNGFQKLESHPSLKAIVPYYITQIYYYQNKNEDLLEYAIPLLESGSAKRESEIARMIGEAYYRDEKYKKSVPFLKKYVDKKRNIASEDLYQLAYAQYKSNLSNEAIESFERLASQKDTLGQLSYYYLGDIFLKNNEKEKARVAFKYASSVDFDEELAENALFNYAKLAYDLYDPYQEAIKSFELFLKKYPYSSRKDQAYRYLLDVYVNTKNYDQALSALDKIELKDLKLRRAYQKIAYSKGVEVFNNQKKTFGSKGASKQGYLTAIDYFEQSLKYQIDNKLIALAYYWMGEANYKIKNYNDAVVLFEKFKYSPATSNTEESEIIDYNLGYTYYKVGMDQTKGETGKTNSALGKSIEAFRKYSVSKHGDTLKLNDAYLRIADAYFIQRNFDFAADFYQQSVALNQLNPDYALMQLAQSNGVLGKDKEKIENLTELVTTYPTSSYLDDAFFLIGEAYFGLNELDQARTYYSALIEKGDVVAGAIRQTSLVRLALIDYQTENLEGAVGNFQNAIEMNPRNKVSEQALEGIQEVYTKLGDTEAYFEWYAKLGLPEYSSKEKDSFLFDVAREKYLDNKFEKSIVSFQTYLDQFPNGLHQVDANYFKADCHLKLKQNDLALAHYDSVVVQPISDYTEDAVLQAARLHVERKEWEQVVFKYLILEDVTDYYPNRLEARIGLMRAYYESGNKKLSSRYAKIVAGNNKVPNEVKFEAHLTMAKCAHDMGDLNKALEEYQATVDLTKNEIGAEAKYNVALIQYTQQDYDASKATIIELAKQIPAYRYWISKGFLLLADNYIAKEDLFHAEHTLQMILENEEEEEIKDLAMLKMAEIDSMREEEELLEENDDWEFDFDTEESNDSTVIEMPQDTIVSPIKSVE
jgi:tetratricopeptide (TPR) repeat protein